MKILVACEESQAVTIEMRKLGHEAYSCDILPCSGGHPEWHIQDDVLKILNPQEHPQAAGTWHGGYERFSAAGIMFATCDSKAHWVEKWDMIIAHPPCTYLTGAGAVELSKHPERLKKGFDGATFFIKILNADCDKICVENPPPMKRFGLPKYTQLIRAYKIGENHNKAYCLWLKGLPELKVDETSVKPKAEYTWIHKKSGKKKTGSKWYNSDTKNHSSHRSKTPKGLAVAMAEQWAGKL